LPGASLNDSELRLAQQATRAGQQSRGMSFGPGQSFEESLNALNYGRQLEGDRRAFAGGTAGLLDSFYGRSLNAILGRDISGAAGGLAGMGQGGGMAGGPLSAFMNPESQYSYGVNDFNANSQQSANNIGAQNNAAMLGGIMSMIGNLGGGAMSMGMCWVAREVYGGEVGLVALRPDSTRSASGATLVPKWEIFRQWLLTRAPLALVHAYLRDGQEYARYLASRPALKARVRRFMDSKLATLDSRPSTIYGL
jgi:hypothetical protein